MAQKGNLRVLVSLLSRLVHLVKHRALAAERIGIISVYTGVGVSTASVPLEEISPIRRSFWMFAGSPFGPALKL